MEIFSRWHRSLRALAPRRVETDSQRARLWPTRHDIVVVACSARRSSVKQRDETGLESLLEGGRRAADGLRLTAQFHRLQRRSSLGERSTMRLTDVPAGVRGQV